MKLRQQGNFGLTDTEMKDAYNIIRTKRNRMVLSLLVQSAKESNASIAQYMITSLLECKSYDLLICQGVPINRNDFYVYRRLTLSIFYKKYKRLGANDHEEM